MANDFHPDTAENIVDYISQGADMPPAPSTVFVTLYDDEGNELDGSLQNGRVSTSTPGDWTKTNTEFENDDEINFGEATEDITVQEVALKDDDETDGNTTVFVKGAINNAPEDFASGTEVLFEAGQLTFDVLD